MLKYLCNKVQSISGISLSTATDTYASFNSYQKEVEGRTKYVEAKNPDEKIKTKRKWLYGVVGLFATFLIIIISWMVLETGVEVTSHADFCGTCHVMKSMVASYKASTHGGNNPRGIMAPCTDCHVSHENVFTHFVGKARSGTHDIWVVLTTDEEDNDWQALRLKREEYVYDSGCMTCHRNLENATDDTKEHQSYFAGLIDSECVSCHEEVGHSNLNKYLISNKYATGKDKEEVKNEK